MPFDMFSKKPTGLQRSIQNVLEETYKSTQDFNTARLTGRLKNLVPSSAMTDKQDPDEVIAEAIKYVTPTVEAPVSGTNPSSKINQALGLAGKVGDEFIDRFARRSLAGAVWKSRDAIVEGGKNFVNDMTKPNPKTWYGTLLPLAREEDGTKRFGAPQIAQDAYRAITAPKRALTGELQPEKMPEEALNFNSTFMGAGAVANVTKAVPKGAIGAYGGKGVAGATDLRKPLSKEEAFNKLARDQRGDPEIAMLRAQKKLGGGVMSYALEHTGDLTHRIAEQSGTYGSEYVAPKVERVLRMLKNPYGFKREHEENLINNKRLPEDEKAVLEEYAAAHERLVTYNPVQEAGKQAAIKLARKDFDGAIKELEFIKKTIDDGTYEELSQQFNLPDKKELFAGAPPGLTGGNKEEEKKSKLRDFLKKGGV